ncbi:CoA transferase [Polaromonas sp. P1-6]|nr:CoA transferase [Polaromonas sp. P1-6]
MEDRVDPDYSLPFSYYNAGKRSVCLDLSAAVDRESFKRLVRSADIVLETAAPGYMASLGLGYDELSLLNPGLVMTSITPFGQSGPYAAYAGDDIVALAMGGMLHLGGYFDSPPVAVHGNQAWLAAAQFAAVATMMSAFDVKRGVGVLGRHIDVSMQECVVMGMENAIQFYDLEGIVRRREAGQQRWAGAGVFDCADGQVYLIAGGFVPAHMRESNVRWLIDAGIAEAECMLDPKWSREDFQTTDEAREIFARLFGEFALQPYQGRAVCRRPGAAHPHLPGQRTGGRSCKPATPVSRAFCPARARGVGAHAPGAGRPIPLDRNALVGEAPQRH